MKSMSFVIFFSIFFLLWAGVNYYIFIHGWHALPAISWVKAGYTCIFLFLSTAYILSRFLERTDTSDAWIAFLSKTGSFWFAAVLYLVLFLLLMDLARLVNHFFPFISNIISSDKYGQFKLTLFYIVSGSVFLILLGGYINARNPIVRDVKIHIPKKSDIPELRIALVSDIHFGALLGKSEVEKLVKKINQIQPDIVLLAGDIMEEQKISFKKDIGGPLRDVYAPLGVWAVTGNHEYINGAESAVNYLKSIGIQFLRDTIVEFPGKFMLVGREDRDAIRHKNRMRKSLAEILMGKDRNLPVILMDHQPLQLKEAMDNHIDLQLSGHTHHGQMWPMNFFTKLIYEQSHGYFRKGDTQYYISNGYGTWGPRVRIGNRPELAQITVSFEQKLLD